MSATPEELAKAAEAMNTVVYRLGPHTLTITKRVPVAARRDIERRWLLRLIEPMLSPRKDGPA